LHYRPVPASPPRWRRAPVELDLNLGPPPHGEHIKVAAYYIASEALGNAAKHAQASLVDLRIRGRDDTPTLSIRDDGIGGADPSRGSGIIGLKDRVEPLGTWPMDLDFRRQPERA
jgi:signal transduction histidine kinase